MPGGNPRATASIFGHPVHTILVPIPIACFIGTLLSDIAYAETANMQWANFSAWMLAIGILVAIVAAIFGLIDFLGDARIRDLMVAWVHFIGNATAVVLSIINAFVHSRDAYTSVVPAGLILSALVVAILVVTGWLGGSLVFRHRVGIAPEDRP
jgi:uncharacterized membrane protein